MPLPSSFWRGCLCIADSSSTDQSHTTQIWEPARPACRQCQTSRLRLEIRAAPKRSPPQLPWLGVRCTHELSLAAILPSERRRGRCDNGTSHFARGDERPLLTQAASYFVDIHTLVLSEICCGDACGLTGRKRSSHDSQA